MFCIISAQIKLRGLNTSFAFQKGYNLCNCDGDVAFILLIELKIEANMNNINWDKTWNKLIGRTAKHFYSKTAYSILFHFANF